MKQQTKIISILTLSFLAIALGVINFKGMPSADAAGALNAPASAKHKIATFAGGCFWCMEPPFDKLNGVISTTSGYTGGNENNPTYQRVSAGRTGHTEAVRVEYDPTKVSYEKLVDTFWHQINPTTPNRQFVDVGSQYRTGIFYHSAEQKKIALASKAKLEKANVFGAPIVTEITEAGNFWPAEEYHQDYYQKHAYKYKFYRFNSGRDQYLESIWGKNK
jgi:methionine-S-sulfoxide reductase